MFQYFQLLKKIFTQIVWPFAIWARTTDGDLLFDENGKPVPNKIATAIARLTSLTLTAFAVTEVFGVPVDKIITTFTELIPYFF